MNDAEIEAAILAAHYERVAEDKGTGDPASPADEAMEESVEEHFGTGLHLQDANHQVLLAA